MCQYSTMTRCPTGVTSASRQLPTSCAAGAATMPGGLAVLRSPCTASARQQAFLSMYSTEEPGQLLAALRAVGTRSGPKEPGHSAPSGFKRVHAMTWGVPPCMPRGPCAGTAAGSTKSLLGQQDTRRSVQPWWHGHPGCHPPRSAWLRERCGRLAGAFVLDCSALHRCVHGMSAMHGTQIPTLPS